MVKYGGVYSTPDAPVVVWTTWRIKNPSRLEGEWLGSWVLEGGIPVLLKGL